MRALAIAAALGLAGCSTTMEVTKVVTPRSAMTLRPTKLVPVAIARGDERVPLPDGAVVGPASVRAPGGGGFAHDLAPGDAMELDERGAVVGLRTADGAWTDFKPGAVTLAEGAGTLRGASSDGDASTIPLQRGDRIVMRGTLEVGDELPGGARVVQKRGTGFLVFGVLSITFGYIPAIIGGAASKDESIDRPLFVPFVGPWIALANRLANPCVPDPIISGANCAGPSMANFGYVVSGITQGLGAIFVVVGLPSHAELVEPEPDDEEGKRRTAKPSWHVLPFGLPGGGGLGIGGRF